MENKMKKRPVPKGEKMPPLPTPGFYGEQVRSPQATKYNQFSELSYLGASQRRAEEVARMRKGWGDISTKARDLASFSGEGTFCFEHMFPKKGVEKK